MGVWVLRNNPYCQRWPQRQAQPDPGPTTPAGSACGSPGLMPRARKVTMNIGMNNPSGASRRDFLSRTAAGLAAASAATQLRAAAGAKVSGSNDRINIGMIGVGNKGRGHQRQLAARIQEQGDIQVVAISDIYSKRLTEAGERSKVESKSLYPDYRELLARPDIDAVWIATPDHWHAPMAIDAMRAGKDVYLEKPMTLTIDEAHKLASEVKATGRVLQVGSQHTSDLRYHRAREVIEKGWIGKVLWAQNTYSRNSVYGEWNYHIDDEGTPENIDWKAFLGSAPKRPFSRDRFFRWRKYWDYSGGIATDLFYHRLAPLVQMAGIDYPTRVSAHGGIYVHKDREVPDTYATTVEFQDWYATLSASMGNAAGTQHLPTVVYGHEATIRFVNGAVLVTPEYQFRKKFQEATGKSEELVIEVDQKDVSADHIANFLASVRSREQPVFNADFGCRVMTAIKMGVDSYREGKMLAWDASRQRVVQPKADRPGYEGDGQNHEEPPRKG
ncbi:MAG: gfo/Idh/MocA family oxidoreductase [Acidobacteria bacterium]|nr:gfo/Idh/MocA family oxidoreductase [Acidobacteriota bacterium]